ncbi:MAG TPA: phosphohistidine phosphatase SixA [Bryobacteraceae bacterium]|jgi:phosphohistidine phosphatase|nr:phosphohistidine phosphatase SixA [Bryobacteraceae bacterium]
MELYLLRHGVAQDGGAQVSDAERALTSEGRRKLRTVLDAAAAAGLKPTLLLTSPLKRAVQTAEVAQEVLKYKNELLRTKALAPGATVEQVWDEIRVHSDEPSLLLVGHNPLFSELSAYLLGANEVQVDFKKGSILRVDIERFAAKPKGVLRWYLTPKLANRD